MSVEEIAQRMNLSTRRVQMILQEAVLKLRDALANDRVVRDEYEGAGR
jgi:DNA-directed RNA polymerase specialized sigma24 family protein